MCSYKGGCLGSSARPMQKNKESPLGMRRYGPPSNIDLSPLPQARDPTVQNIPTSPSALLGRSFVGWPWIASGLSICGSWGRGAPILTGTRKREVGHGSFLLGSVFPPFLLPPWGQQRSDATGYGFGTLEQIRREEIRDIPSDGNSPLILPQFSIKRNKQRPSFRPLVAQSPKIRHPAPMSQPHTRISKRSTGTPSESATSSPLCRPYEPKRRKHGCLFRGAGVTKKPQAVRS